MKSLQNRPVSSVSRAMLRITAIVCVMCALVGCEEPTEADLANEEPYLYETDEELPPCELRTDTK